MTALVRDVPCPRCEGTGVSTWTQPSGLAVPVRCGLCRGAGRCDAKRAAGEAPRPMTARHERSEP